MLIRFCLMSVNYPVANQTGSPESHLQKPMIFSEPLELEYLYPY